MQATKAFGRGISRRTPTFRRYNGVDDVSRVGKEFGNCWHRVNKCVRVLLVVVASSKL